MIEFKLYVKNIFTKLRKFKNIKYNLNSIKMDN